MSDRHYRGAGDAQSTKRGNWLPPDVKGPVTGKSAIGRPSGDPQKKGTTYFVFEFECGKMQKTSDKDFAAPAEGASRSWVVDMGNAPALGNLKSWVAALHGLSEVEMIGLEKFKFSDPAAGEAYVRAHPELVPLLQRFPEILPFMVAHKDDLDEKRQPSPPDGTEGLLEAVVRNPAKYVAGRKVFIETTQIQTKAKEPFTRHDWSALPQV